MCDRTMVEQVLLNLTRNGIQAMEGAYTPLERRVLHMRVRPVNADWVEFTVADAGPASRPTWRSVCSRPSSPPAAKAWAWACRCAAR
jgi:C4-dicarboxylate-specific signal transduction histidine kinase